MTLTARPLIYASAALAMAVGLGVLALGGRGRVSGAQADPTPPRTESVVAGPGRVEPLSEEVRVGAQIEGRLRHVAVEEGDHVTAGQVLAVLENDDYTARIASAAAQLQITEAEARRVVNGARDHERREAAASLHEAEAVLTHARANHQRRRELFAETVISRDEMDKAEEQLRVSESRVDALRERHALVDAAAREEDAARARADVALARARLDEAVALREKTIIRAPAAGLVLRTHRRAGESVSTQVDAPVVTLADRSTVRVRVDVDETDVGRVAVGQAAYVTAEAFGARRFPGRVSRVGHILGRKNVRTDEPSERVDQKILETLVELSDGHELPIGLRVQAFIRDRP